MSAVPPLSLAFPPQPTPTGLIVVHLAGHTVITREWSDGDHRRCRLCPRDQCGATARGTCTVIARGFVDAASAAGFAVDAPAPL